MRESLIDMNHLLFVPLRSKGSLPEETKWFYLRPGISVEDFTSTKTQTADVAESSATDSNV